MDSAANPPPRTGSGWRVERARREDWARIREICCVTSPAVARMTPGWREFFGELWVGPYESLAPEWTWVARREGSAGAESVVGYLTGVPATQSFEGARAWRHRPGLALGLALRRYEWNPDARRWLRRALRLDVHPERCFGPEVARELRASFPAHLHINLAPEAQGQGAGGLLVEAFAHALLQARVPGIHLFCGQGPVRFYEKNGFSVRARVTLPSSGAEVFVMVRALGPALSSSDN